MSVSDNLIKRKILGCDGVAAGEKTKDIIIQMDLWKEQLFNVSSHIERYLTDIPVLRAKVSRSEVRGYLKSSSRPYY